jgi:acetyltransferase-like isoleucine patch superfamily enzyme
MDAEQETITTKGNSTIRVGAYTYGARKLMVREWGEGANLIIGKFCSLAGGVQVMLGGNHRTDWISTYPFGWVNKKTFGRTQVAGHPATRGDVVIGDDVWIGQNAVIQSGVTIGSGAAVASHAVVVKDVAPYTIVGGNPAQPIRTRFAPEIVELLLQLRWWDLPPETVRDLVPTLSAAPDAEILRGLIAKHWG